MLLLKDIEEAQYCRFISTFIKQIKKSSIENLAEEIEGLNVGVLKPTFSSFGKKLIMRGGSIDVLMGTKYFNDHPDDYYEIHEFESLKEGNESFKTVMGSSLEEYDDLIRENSTEISQNEDYFVKRILNEGIVQSTSDAMGFIKRWIKNFKSINPNKAPFLVGHSGIAKSALVKEVVRQLNKESIASGDWGFRLVDLRAAFLDRVDLMGYITVNEDSDSLKKVWSDSPKSVFLYSTTPFLEAGRKWILDNPRTEQNLAVFDVVKEIVKTPVIFLDELNRAPIAIQAQVMVIINEHRLNSYDLSLCPVIAAANIPIDMGHENDNSDELNKRYDIIKYVIREEVYDPAIIDRVIPLTISGFDSSVNTSGYLYLKSVYSHVKIFNEVITQYKNDDLYFHNIKDVDKTGKYPTFRGWSFVGDYLESCEKSGEIPVFQIIESLLGENIASSYFKDLVQTKKVFVTSDFIDTCIRNKIPTMILGMMGIGKTAQIDRAIKNNSDCVKISIDLSSRTRTDVSGFPTKFNLTEFLFDENPKLKDTEAYHNFFKYMNSISDVPKETTITVGNETIARKIKQCKEENKKLVIVFDEVNRCDPIVQSSIFETISDCFVGSTRIKLLNGTVETLENLYNKYKDSNKGFWVYSSTNDGQIVAGYAIHPRLITTEKNLVKVILDNGLYEICTDDHKWMLRDGTWKYAKDLEENDSLMSLYTRISSEEDGDYLHNFEMIFDNKLKEWKYTNILINTEVEFNNSSAVIIGCINTLKTNLNNLLDSSNKIEYNLSSLVKKIKEILSPILQEYNLELTNKNYRKIIYKLADIDISLFNTLKSLSIECGYKSVNDTVYCNHKILKIEYLTHQEPVYDITVNKYENFALESGVFVHNSRFMGCSLEGVDFTVVAAGNWNDPENDESNFQVSPIDTASFHRFATRIITKISEEDVIEIIRYVRDNYPEVYKALKFDEVPVKTVMEMLNGNTFEAPEKEGLQWMNASFSARTFQLLNTILSMYDVVMLSNTDISDKNSIETLLKNKKYILNELHSDSPVELTDSVAQMIVKYYSSKYLTMQEFLKQTINIIKTNTDQDVIDQVLSYVQFTEKEAYLQITASIKNSLPEKYRDMILNNVDRYYSDKTNSLINISLSLDNSGLLNPNQTNDEITRLLTYSLKFIKVDEVTQFLYDLINKSIENFPGGIFTESYLNNLIRLSKKFVVTLTFNLHDILLNTSVSLDKKITIRNSLLEFLLYKEFYTEFYNSLNVHISSTTNDLFKQKFGNIVNELETRAFYESIKNSVSITLGYTEIGNKKYVNPFNIKVNTNKNEDNYLLLEIFLDDSVFKLVFLDENKIEFKIIDYNKNFELFCFCDLDKKLSSINYKLDKVPHVDLSIMEGATKTYAFFDSNIDMSKNIPQSLLNKVNFDNLDFIPVTNDIPTVDLSSFYIHLFSQLKILNLIFS